ncbi:MULTISPECIES: pectinesterase family protein [Niastella]|uniref:T9SS type A sorting domain-containing protein n=1 Tax=Niastella soli TaxID=2821487 RepID=A0ABS3YMX0_9BACT|nr:pectinesterase family protein [Niastella soli]MBO9198790.1 T9SS type A sorting domain-containing protein [Niastella soli]
MRNFTHLVTVLLCSLLTIATQAQQPAFPGAEGAGMYTTGGRGSAGTPTTVFEVTNLNDDNNPGSLRYAVSTAAANRTVVFRVSGTIHLTSKLNIRDNTTIAGQTAPGDGICLADYPVVISGNNVIVRYMRFRMGDKNQKKVDANGDPVDGSGGDDAFGALGPNNLIIDHCSVSWSSDEALTIYRGDNLTIQWCFMSEPLNFSYHFETGDATYEYHGYNGIQGGKRATIHHNLYAHARNRNPRFAGISTYSPSTTGVENVDYYNNVLYNWGINTVYGGEGGNYNVMNNYYKWGPSTSSGVRYRICNPSFSATIPWGKWYVNGNYVDGSTQNTNNNWSGVETGTTAADTVQIKQTSAFDLGFPKNMESAIAAYNAVLLSGGCSLPRRDTLDDRIVDNVRNRTGRFIDVQGGYPHGTAYSLTVNAWPTLNSTTAPVDTDHDGMPDDWETSHGLNPNDAADRNVYDGSGYTMLENYLNGVSTNNTNPVIAVGGSLNPFTQMIGAPSATQTYSVAGYNLSANVTLTPPAGYQLSLDGTTWSGSANPITLIPVSGSLTSTNILVRLNATVDGNYDGNIIHVSTNASTVNLAVTGIASSSVSGLGVYPSMDGGFEKQTIGTVSTAAPSTTTASVTTVWTTSGNADIKNDGTARSGNNYFTYTSSSLSTKNNFAPSQTSPLYPANTKYIVQYYYRAPAPASGNQVSGMIAVSDNVAVSGNFAINHATAAWTATNNAWLKAYTTRSVNTAYTPVVFLAGFRFNGGGTAAIAKPFDIDDFVVYPADDQSNPAPDVAAPDVATAPLATGNANNNSIALSWTAPATGVDGGGYVVVRSTSATPPVPNANGIYIVGNSMGTGYQVVYLGPNTLFTDADPAISPTTKYYYYIFTADKAYNYSATAATINVQIDGGSLPPPAVSTTGTLSAFSQTTGTPSAAQTFTVSGANLTGNVTITAPANYQLSTDNGTTWSSSMVTLTAVSGAVATKTISVRLNAAATGSYAGNIVVSSTGATAINIAVSGNTVTGGAPPPAGVKAIVAKDGSGNYTSIQAAINAAPTAQTAPYKIYIRKGKYVETVTIPSNKPFIQLVGENMAETIISYDNYSGKANSAGGTYGTSTCATVIVNAPDVMFMNLSMENATGYGINANAVVPAPGDGPQAVAVYTTSDRVVFYNCRMNSGQDTYYGGNNAATRCYFKNCYVDGNTDFLFGSSTIIFDTCIVYPRTRLDNASGGYVTAVNTKDVSGYGYVFRDCKITQNRGFTTYTLGRPWQNDNSTADAAKSRNKTVFLNTTMGATIKPEGWSTWDAGTNTSYITYGEYNSKNYDGTPVNVSSRVAWSKQLTATDAAKYYNNDEVFTNANTPAMAAWNPFSTWAELGTVFTPELSVSNLIAKKGTGTTALTWNLTWPMPGITCELYRSNDKTNFSLINTQTSTEDYACNFNYAENIPPPGQTYYYIVRASKAGYTTITSDTASVTSVPTITISGTLGSFLQGLGTPSAIQTFVLSGANLMDNITITPPAGYQVSVDNTNWYSSGSPLIVTQSNGIIANTYVSVRLNGTTVGNYNGNIVNTSTNAASVSVAVNGAIQADPLGAGAVVLEQWPLTADNLDDATVRAAGVVGTTPDLNNLMLSNGTTVVAVPPYSALHGQAFAAAADGSWNNGGPGSTLSRKHYEQFTVVAAPTHSLRVDSLILSTSFYNTSSGTKVAVLYSKTNFRTDSTEIKVAAKNGVTLTPGTNGTFTNAFDVSNQTAGNTDVFAMLVNGSAGVTVKAGDTLFFRIYNCTGSTSVGRYVKVKNLIVKGLATKNPASGDFRTVKSGEWSDMTTWQKWDGANWVDGMAATDYPAYDNGVNVATIQNGHTISYTQAFTNGFGYIQKTVIAAGGQLIVAAGKSLKVAGIDGTTIVLQVDGTLTNLGSIGSNGKVLYQVNGKMVNSGSMSFNTGDSVAVGAAGIFQHDMNGSLPPRISFASGSTLLVTGIKTAQTNLFTTPTTVSNLVWNCAGQQNYFALRNTLAAVTGNFTVQSTGTTYVALSQGTATLRIGGNYVQTGGSIYFNESNSGIIDSLVVAGDFTVSGGTFNANMKNSDPLYIKLNGSNRTFSHLGTLGNTHILVNGYYNLGSNLTLPTAGFGLVVNGTLNTGTYIVSGPGATTIANSAIVSFGAATGIDGNFANSGTKQYSINANYIFNGTAVQTTGTTMPAGVHTLTVNNSTNVTLSAPLTAGIVNLTNGKLLLGDNTLTDTTITGNVPVNYFVTNGTGKLRQYLGATAGSILFPVGSSVTSYTPATLNNTGTADNFSVNVKDKLDYVISDTTKIVRKQWTITPDNTAGAANVAVSLGWVTADQGSAFNATTVKFLNYRNNAWADIAGAVTGSGTAAVPYVASASNFTQFGVFVIGNAVPVSTIVTTGALNAFAQIIGSPSATQTYTVSGNNLTGNITITPPPNYQVSIDGTIWYSNTSPLVLTPAGGKVANTIIQVRLNAAAAGTYSGNITNTSTGATTQNVAVTGITNALIANVNISKVILEPFSQTLGKPTDAQTFQLTVTNIGAPLTITPPEGYEISADSGKTWYTAASVPSITAGIGNALSKVVMVRLNATAAGTYDGNIVIQTNNTTPVNVAVTGNAYNPYTINPNPAENYVNVYHPKLYTVAAIRIYNMNGRVVGLFYSKPTANYTTINISNLPNGMYFIEVARLNEKVLLKFIKQ